MRHWIFCIIASIFAVIPCGCASPSDKDEMIKMELSQSATSRPVTTQPDVVKDSLTLTEAVNLAVQYNPELKSAEKEIDAASARIIQAKLLPNPSIFAETEDGRSKSWGFGNEYKSVFGLSQPIPLGGKINARTVVAEKEKQITLSTYELNLRQIIARTKKAFVDILAAQELVNIAADNLEIARKLFDSAKARLEAGAAPETEQIKAQIELSQAEVSLRNAQTEFTQAQKRLNTLLGNVDINIKNYDGALREIIPDLQDKQIEEMVLASYPELLSAVKAKELAQAQLELAQAERYPDIDIGVGTGKIRGTEETNIIEWGVNIPFPLFDRNQGRIREAEALIIKAQKDHEAALNQVCLETRQTLLALGNTANYVRTYKEKVVPQAERSLSLISEGYRQGKFTYIELLDAQRTLAETRENYLKLLAELNNLVIEIEQLTGKPIEELK
ncbi:MAG: TolC family protein [Planctomycetota bacterium]